MRSRNWRLAVTISIIAALYIAAGVYSAKAGPGDGFDYGMVRELTIIDPGGGSADLGQDFAVFEWHHSLWGGFVHIFRRTGSYSHTMRLEPKYTELTKFRIRIDTGGLIPHFVGGTGADLSWHYNLSDSELTIDVSPIWKWTCPDYVDWSCPTENFAAEILQVRVWVSFEDHMAAFDGFWFSTNATAWRITSVKDENGRPAFELFVDGKPGTGGGFEAFIPDAFLRSSDLDIDGLRVYFDGNLLAESDSYTLTRADNEEGWLLSCSFSYSAHIIAFLFD